MCLRRPLRGQPGYRVQILRVGGRAGASADLAGKGGRVRQAHPAGSVFRLRVYELLHDGDVAAEVLVVVDGRLDAGRTSTSGQLRLQRPQKRRARLVVRHRSKQVALVRVHSVEHQVPQRLGVVLLRNDDTCETASATTTATAQRVPSRMSSGAGC